MVLRHDTNQRTQKINRLMRWLIVKGVSSKGADHKLRLVVMLMAAGKYSLADFFECRMMGGEQSGYRCRADRTTLGLSNTDSRNRGFRRRPAART